MKPTDLAKLKGKKIEGQQRQTGTPERFGKDAHKALDKRSQRERDREQGLVPFACKLHGDLVKQIRDLAASRNMGLSEITAELIGKGLAKQGSPEQVICCRSRPRSGRGRAPAGTQGSQARLIPACAG